MSVILLCTSLPCRRLCCCVEIQRQTWSTRSARNITASEHLAEDGGTTRDSDVTSGVSQTSRAHKQRKLTGTETDIMHQMLFSTAKPPLPTSHEPAQENRKPGTKQIASSSAERKRSSSSRGNVVDTTALEVKRKERTADSDEESNASADTYTLDSKEELRLERDRIDVAFGIVSGSKPDDRPPPSTDMNGAQQPDDDEVADQDEDNNDCSLQIREESDDELDQPRLVRTKNQTLFTEDSASSSGECSANASFNHDDDPELAVVGRENSTTPDQGALPTEWTSSQSSVKRAPSEIDGIALADKLEDAFARQNSASGGSADNNTVAVDSACKEPTLVENSKADASFGDDDDDDNDDLQPADVPPLKTTENRHEVKKTCSDRL